MKRKIIFLSVLLLFGVYLVSAQQLSVSGVVTDASDGSPLIGVSVLVKGTTQGTTTDVNGKYRVSAHQGSTLVFTYIGMEKQEISVTTNVINVALQSDTKVLDEVVAVGYGTVKKKLVTGATVQVSGDNLQKLSTTSAFTALQSQTPGVNITQSSGQPGEGFKVNIRGIGTTGNSSPLYVIDGVTGGDINSLNPADIESIDVLKDAASSAIYGARAANGVVLVTTKQGKAGKMQVTLDSYYGIQNVYKMPSLLNAQQYMAIMDEVNFNEGLDLYKWNNILGSYYSAAQDGSWKGTNWLNSIRNKNAPTQNHSINIVGGNDISKFSMGVSYTSQEGIFGAPVASDYQRSTVRLNSDHVILRLDGRDVIKVGENISYNYAIKSGIGIGNQYWNDISNMLRAIPIMPIYDADGNYFDNSDKTAMGLNGYDAQVANPIADMVYERGYNSSKSHNLNMSANLQIQPIKNLIYKSQFGYKMSGSTYRSYTPSYDLSTTVTKAVSSVSQSASLGWSYSWENTLNYKFNVDTHHFDALVGQSMEKWGMGESLNATNGDLLFDDFKHAYLSNSQGVSAGQTSVGGSPWGEGGIASFFGRVNYDWKETYMLSVVMRADGSSNFAKGHRWGYFPSVSAGWVMTNESFMESTKNWLDFLKVRGSWGQNGNCNISNFQYLATVSFDATAAYSFGNNKDTQTTGGYANILPNPDVTWETAEQTDLGIDARFMNSRLSVALDFYDKATKNWLVVAPQLASYGTGAPYINGGDVDNKGFEVALGWNDHMGKDLTYGINANLSFNKNEVTRIANSEGIIHGATNVLAQGTTEMYRAEVGYPIGYFWGYKTAGVFQNQEEIDAWKADGNGILQSNVQPGDLKFVDLDHNGEINSDDKTMIGDPNPDFNLGFSFNVGYKGFDFSVTTHGAFGQQIAKSYRQTSRIDNYTTEVYQRWHGEGTSNKYPRLTANTNANYMNISDIYIEDGDYLKCQNITLGYDFKKLAPKMPLQQARIFFSAQNLFTITNYSGMDPEIGSNAGTSDSWASGIDIGFYPSPRTYLVGVNIKF
jgi:TonB-dependent starch-binding outer membrane protein SusC